MKYLIKNKAWDITEDYNKEKLLYLLIDRPDNIINRNKFIWENNENQSHREYDLPAIILLRYGYLAWWKEHKRNRNNNKPAVIYSNGIKDYL